MADWRTVGMLLIPCPYCHGWALHWAVTLSLHEIAGFIITEKRTSGKKTNALRKRDVLNGSRKIYTCYRK
jgi:hypothetical protein